MERIKKLFNAYPNATELYQDGNGHIWVNKETAEAQTPGKVKIISKTIRPKYGKKSIN